MKPIILSTRHLWATVLLFIVLDATAQINLPKVRIPAKEKKETPPAQTPAATPAPAPAPSTPSPTPPVPAVTKPGRPMPGGNANANAPAAPKEPVELDFSSTPASPAIAFDDLLDRYLEYNPTNGELRIDGLHASFLPQKTTKGTPANYSEYNNPILSVDVVEVTKNELKGTLYFKAELEIIPFYKMKLFNDARNLDKYPYFVKIFEGQYELRFKAGSKHFYTFPFSVSKKSNPDVYAPVKDMYFANGLWSQWGYVEFLDEDFTFKTYHTTQDAKIKNQNGWNETRNYEFTMKLYLNGKIVGYHELNGDHQLEKQQLNTEVGHWIINGGAFMRPGSTDLLTRKDMPDGSYRVDVEVFRPDLPGGKEIQQFSFVMKGGQPVSDPRADRSLNKDPLTLVEQGTKLFYVKRSK
jgi:hypothetical protein